MTSFNERGIRGQGVRWRNSPVGPVFVAVIVLAGLAVLNANRLSLGSPAAPEAVQTPPVVGSASPGASEAAGASEPAPATAPPTTPNPVTVAGGVWFTEIDYKKWVMGVVGPGRPVVLPPGAQPLAGGTGLVVTATHSPDATAIVVWEADTGKPRVETTLPFEVWAAAVAPGGSTAYLSGRSIGRPFTDTGVWALTVDTGELTQVVPAAEIRPEWEGNFERGAVTLSPGGATLATTLCGGPTGREYTSCDAQVLDLASGTLIGSFGPLDSNVAAVTDDTVFTRTQFVVIAFDVTGRERWRFEAAEVRGSPIAVSDGVIVPYAETGTEMNKPTRLGKLSSASGAVTDLIVGESGTSISVWSSASSAGTIVGAFGDRMESADPDAKGGLDLFLIDAATGQVTRSALRITMED